MYRGGKASITASAASATGDHDFLVGLRKVEDFFAGVIVVHNRSDRNLQNYIFALAPGLVGPFAVPSALGVVFGVEAEVHQRIVPLAGLHDDVAALAAVAARGSAPRYKLFPAKGHAAISAVAGLDSDFCFVDEHESFSAVAVGGWQQRSALCGSLRFQRSCYEGLGYTRSLAKQKPRPEGGGSTQRTYPECDRRPAHERELTSL